MRFATIFSSIVCTTHGLSPEENILATTSNAKTLLDVIIDALEDIKAKDIRVLDVAKITAVSDFLAIASGDSSRQTKALASNVMDKVREAGFGVYGTEGGATGEWVLVDCGDVVVHIMQPAIREYYKLEELYQEGKLIFPRPKSAKPAKAPAIKTVKKVAKPRATAKTKVAAKKVVAGKPPVAKKVVAKKVAAKKVPAKAVSKKPSASAKTAKVTKVAKVAKVSKVTKVAKIAKTAKVVKKVAVKKPAVKVAVAKRVVKKVAPAVTKAAKKPPAKVPVKPRGAVKKPAVAKVKKPSGKTLKKK